MSSGFLHKLKGDLFLGYRAVIAHPWRKLRDEDLRTGEERFLANYGPEGLLPTTAADREVLNGASRCIHCGLCDAYDPSLSVLPRTVHLGASQLAVSYSRASPDIRHTAEILSRLEEAQLVRAEAVCPTRVPLRQILVYLRRKLEELKAHPPA
jgi:succinate dehydrogenase/fumarate reductase-like Fe-S protein